MKIVPILLAGAGAALAYLLTAPRTHSGDGLGLGGILIPPSANDPNIGKIARQNDDVIVRATLPTLIGTPGIQSAAFAMVHVEQAEANAVYGHVTGLLKPEAGGATYVLEPIQGPIAAVLRNEIVSVERNGTKIA